MLVPILVMVEACTNSIGSARNSITRVSSIADFL